MLRVFLEAFSKMHSLQLKREVKNAIDKFKPTFMNICDAAKNPAKMHRFAGRWPCTVSQKGITGGHCKNLILQKLHSQMKILIHN